MKPIICLLFWVLSLSTQAAAQDENPVQWTFRIEKKDANTYVLKAQADIKDQFHIWALDPGGDGSLIPTAFRMKDSTAITWKGNWQATTPPLTQTLEFVDGAVHWYEKTITFYRLFYAQPDTEIAGEVTFQSCNHASCFPPETKSFDLRVKF